MIELVAQALESFPMPGPGGKRLETKDRLQYVDLALSHGAANAVVRAQFPEQVAKRFEETNAPYEEHRLTHWWMLAPSSYPLPVLEMDLEKRHYHLHHEAQGLVQEVKN